MQLHLTDEMDQRGVSEPSAAVADETRSEDEMNSASDHSDDQQQLQQQQQQQQLVTSDRSRGLWSLPHCTEYRVPTGQGKLESQGI